MPDPTEILQSYYTKTEAQIDQRYKSEGFIDGGVVQLADSAGTLSMKSLSPILRTLLVTDGTVTKLLEAYFWEPVEVVTHKLEVIALTQPLPWLHAARDEEVLLRDVQLRGAHSGRCYATAFSVVRLTVFEPQLVQALRRGAIGLGVLIRDSGLESFRELLELTASTATESYELQRSYRIIASGTPAILISECFPCDLYQSA